MNEATKTREKSRPPKPGSKKAQALKKERAVFALPISSHYQTTVFLKFKSSTDLKLGLGRVHNYYEQQVLNGPLKGVNLPVSCLEEWLDTVTPTVEEQMVLNIIRVKTTLYLIAYLEKDSSTLLHEWAHAVYFYNQDYRKFVLSCWDGLENSTKILIRKELELRNYAQHSFVDEFQAYVRESPGDFGKKLTSILRPIHIEFKKWVNVPHFTVDNE